MDDLFAKSDAKFQAKQQKKATSMPTTTSAVDQATFTKALRNEVEDILESIIKTSPNKKPTSNQQKKNTSPTQKEKKKKSPPTPVRNQQQRTFAEVVSNTKRTNTPSSNVRSSTPRSSDSSSKTTSSTKPNKGGRQVTVQDDTDDEGFTLVQPRQKKTPSATNRQVPKNEVAQDQRTRPRAQPVSRKR